MSLKLLKQGMASKNYTSGVKTAYIRLLYSISTQPLSNYGGFVIPFLGQTITRSIQQGV